MDATHTTVREESVWPLYSMYVMNMYYNYRWLKLKGRNKEALTILSRVNRHSISTEKALEAEEDITKDETTSKKVNKLYLVKELFKYKYRYRNAAIHA